MHVLNIKIDSELKYIWVSCFFLFITSITPVVVIRLAFSYILLASTKKDNVRTFYRMKIDQKVPEIFNFKDIV